MCFIASDLPDNQKITAATAKHMILISLSTDIIAVPSLSFLISLHSLAGGGKYRSQHPLFPLPLLLCDPTYYTHEDTRSLQRPLWKSFLHIF